MNQLSLQVSAKFSHSLKIGLMVVLIALITALGVSLRIYAAHRMPINADEKIYLNTALKYAQFMRQGEWKMLSWYDYNAQHPPFYKIVYGMALLTQPPLAKLWDKDFTDGMAIFKVDARPWGLTERYVSVIIGGLTTLALSAINPVAGLFYAVNTLAVQYNSYIFLEALPTLASFLCVVCYLQWYQRVHQKSRPKRVGLIYLAFSAGFLGMAVASKYTYGVVGIAILIHFLGCVILMKIRPIDLWKLAAWGMLALLVFYICDPYIWKHPVSRLLDSLSFHVAYSQSEKVTSYDYPFYQPLVWFSAPVTTFSSMLKSSASFLIQLDTLISLLALAGLPRLFKRQPLYFIWLVTGLTTLLLWTTKWPQYTMIIMIPVCMSAAMCASWLFDLVKTRVEVRRAVRYLPD